MCTVVALALHYWTVCNYHSITLQVPCYYYGRSPPSWPTAIIFY